jgi:hypothetical protein
MTNAFVQPLRNFQQERDARRRRIIEKRIATTRKRYGQGGLGSSNPRIRMVITPWYRDPDGCMTRRIWAAER